MVVSVILSTSVDLNQLILSQLGMRMSDTSLSAILFTYNNYSPTGVISACTVTPFLRVSYSNLIKRSRRRRPRRTKYPLSNSSRSSDTSSSLLSPLSLQKLLPPGRRIVLRRRPLSKKLSKRPRRRRGRLVRWRVWPVKTCSSLVENCMSMWTKARKKMRIGISPECWHDMWVVVCAECPKESNWLCCQARRWDHVNCVWPYQGKIRQSSDWWSGGRPRGWISCRSREESWGRQGVAIKVSPMKGSSIVAFAWAINGI